MDRQVIIEFRGWNDMLDEVKRVQIDSILQYAKIAANTGDKERVLELQQFAKTLVYYVTEMLINIENGKKEQRGDIPRLTEDVC